MCPVCGAIKDLIAPLTKEEIQKYYTSPKTPDEEVKEKDVKEDVKGDVKEMKEEKKEEKKEEVNMETKEETETKEEEEKEEQEKKEEEKEEQEKKEEEKEEEKEDKSQVETITEEEAREGEADHSAYHPDLSAFKSTDKGMLFYRYRTPDNKEVSRVSFDYPRITSDEYTQPLLPKDFFEGFISPDMKKTEKMIAIQNEVYARKGFPMFMPIYVPVVVPVIQEVKKEEPKKKGEEENGG